MLKENLQFGDGVSGLDIYGGVFIPERNLNDTQILWQRQLETTPEKPQVKLPNSLLQVELALKELYENDQYVSDEVRAYIDADERTKAFEATTKGVVMETYQAWSENDKQLIAYSFPTIEIYQKGLEDVAILREKFGPDINFEEERRKIELDDAIKLQEAISSGKMNSQLKVTISPFPVGSNSEVAREIGYFTEKMIAMIRVQEYDPEFKIMKTSQIMVEGTNLEVFSKLTALLTENPVSETLSPASLLGTEIYLPKGKIRGVVDVARIYDRILESQNSESFFLGEKKDRSISDYKDISEKTKEIENLTKPIVKHLVQTDIQLAKSLYFTKPTKFIEETIQKAINAVDKNGKPLLNNAKRSVILNSLKSFTVKAAEIVKDFVTKTDYMSMICVTDEKRAKDLFPVKQVYDFRKSYLQNPLGTLTGLHTLTPKQDVFFFFCGGLLKMNSGQDVYDMTSGEFNSFLKEAVPTTNKEKFIKNCGNVPKCGKAINKSMKAGDPCPHCGKLYKGC